VPCMGNWTNVYVEPRRGEGRAPGQPIEANGHRCTHDGNWKGGKLVISTGKKYRWGEQKQYIYIAGGVEPVGYWQREGKEGGRLPSRGATERGAGWTTTAEQGEFSEPKNRK